MTGVLSVRDNDVTRSAQPPIRTLTRMMLQRPQDVIPNGTECSEESAEGAAQHAGHAM
jgi:hypothetical protein